MVLSGTQKITLCNIEDEGEGFVFDEVIFNGKKIENEEIIKIKDSIVKLKKDCIEVQQGGTVKKWKNSGEITITNTTKCEMPHEGGKKVEIVCIKDFFTKADKSFCFQ